MSTFRFWIRMWLLSAAVLASTGCGNGSLSGGREKGTVLPSLPTAIGESSRSKRVASVYQIDVQSPVQQGGSGTRNQGNDLVIAGTGELAWAMYGVQLTDPQRPISVDLEVAEAAVESGGSPLPVNYYVGSSDYSGLSWEWSGPFTSHSTVELNSAVVQRNPRRTSPGDTFYFVVVAGSLSGSPAGPAAVAITSLAVKTSAVFEPTLPGAVFPAANQGNDVGPPSSTDSYSVSVHWEHVSALSAQDEVNIADSYVVYRRSPGGSFVEIGEVNAPLEVYVDPLDNNDGVPSPYPATTYEYYVLGSNEQGASGRDGFTAVTTGNLVVNGQWATHRGSNSRTGCNATMSLGGLLSPAWQTQVDVGTLLDRFEPALSDDNLVVVGAGSVPKQYAFNDGSEVASWPGFSPLPGNSFPTVFGNWLVMPASDEGLTALDMPGGTVRHLESAGPVWGSPLFLEGDIVIADRSGVVMRYDPFSGEAEWQFNAAPASPFSLSPAASANHIYAVDDVGRVFKIDSETGELVDSLNLSAEPVGDSIALDLDRNLLWLGTDESCLIAASTVDMSVVNSWPDVPALKEGVAPCIVGHTDPPLVAVAYSKDTSTTKVLAVNPETMEELWTREYSREPAGAISATADALLLAKENSESGGGSELLVISFTGEKVQRLHLAGGADACGVVLAAGRVIVPTRNDPHLFCFETEPVTPPTWVDEDTGGIGIQNWECAAEGESNDDMRVSWYLATHPDGLLVRYALFYSSGKLPMLEPPYTDTTVISGLTNSDNNSTLVFDLPLGQRYFATVRAYVGTWGVDAVVDSNAEWIGSTPPWHERALSAGSSVLPSEALATFSLTPNESGSAVYVVGAEAGGGKLWNLWRTSVWDSFDFEGDELNAFNGTAVSPSWYSQLFVGRAGGNALGVLERNSKNDWDPEIVISGATPDDSPALSLVMGSQSGLAYTQYISGSEPTSEVDYYAVRNSGGGWGSTEVVETNNVSGSDVDAALDPSDPSKLWVAYQKGSTASSSLPTCTTGELWFAWGNGSGGYSTELVDSGDNSPDSDCGKRVRLALEGSTPHLAYLDLNAAATEPRGRLKHAYHDGAGWQVSTVASFDTSTQTGDYRATYGEVGLCIAASGPVISMLERTEFNSDPGTFLMAEAHVYFRNGSNWDHEVVSDVKPILQKDREPCDIVATPDGYLDLYFVAPPLDSTLDPGRQIVWLRRLD